MSKFRSRLLIGFITLTIVVLVALGLLLGQLLKNFYLNTINQRIGKDVNFIASVIQNEDIHHPSTIAKMKSFSKTLEARIVILNKEGHIIFESASSHLNLKDDSDLIKQITKNHLHETKDFYELHRDYNTYYYGSPLLQDGKIDGFIMLSLPIDSLKKINQQIWLILIGSFAMAIVVIILLGYQLTSYYMRPIELATNAASELAKGNYRARIHEDYEGKTTMLSKSINTLARNLQEMTKEQEMQKNRLQVLIENMGSSLILIDSSGHIILMNRAFKDTFHIDSASLFQLYYKVIPFKEINQLVETIFMTEKKVRKQLLLPFTIERKFFDVYGAPVLGANDEWKGVVLVFHDISELKRLEQVRKDFVANVSHELMTPITSIKGFSETLLDGAMKNEEILEEFLKIILKESNRLKSLIKELLDLSKIEQVGFKLESQNVNLYTIIEEIIAMVKGKLDEKNLHLSLKASDEEIYMLGDYNRLKQIFLNLIDNAINYTPQNRDIFVSIEESQKQIIIQVADTGIGIQQEEIPRIFERFYRVDKARSRNMGGTGLGLAIVKHLVEAHHGKISVQSEFGKGTIFTVIFPKGM